MNHRVVCIPPDSLIQLLYFLQAAFQRKSTGQFLKIFLIASFILIETATSASANIVFFQRTANMKTECRNRFQCQSQQGMVLRNSVLKEDRVIAPGIRNTGKLKIIVETRIRITLPCLSVRTETQDAVFLFHFDILTELIASQYQLIGYNKLISLIRFTPDIQLNFHAVRCRKGSNHQHIIRQLIEPARITNPYLKKRRKGKQPVLAIQFYPKPLARVFQNIQKASGSRKKLMHRSITGYCLTMKQTVNIRCSRDKFRRHSGQAGRCRGNMSMRTLANQFFLLENNMSVIFCKERKQPIFSSFFQLTLRKITVDHFLTPLRRGIRFTKDSLYPHRRQLVRSFSVSKVCKFLRNCLTEFQFTNCIGMIFTEQCVKSKSCFSIQHDFFRLKCRIAALKLKVSVFQITQKCFRLMIGFIGQAKELHTIGRITDSTSTDHSLLEIRESSRLRLILTGTDAIAVFCFKNSVAQILRNIKLIGQYSAFISKAHILAINNVNLLSMTRKLDIPEP